MSLIGKDNEEKIWNFLSERIKNDYGTAGMMGNLYAESGLRSDNLQNSYEKKLNMNDIQYTQAVDNNTYTNFDIDRAGYGLAQWTSAGRKTGIHNFIKGRKVSISDLESQLEYLWIELNTSYKKSVLSVLQTATDIRTASNAVLIKFEAPASKNTQTTQDKRARYSQIFYDKYAKKEEKNVMSNSPLVDYTKISPNKTSPRNHIIDTITIHCVVGQVTAERLGEIFTPTSKRASSNYGVDKDGRIGMYVEEKDRSWCSSNAKNDNRAITIEVASDTTTPYAVNDKALNALIKLCADICKRNNIKELKWKADKSLIGQVDKQNMTVHRWFAAKACPGDYLYNKHSYIAAEVNKLLGAAPAPVPIPPSPTPAAQPLKIEQNISSIQNYLNTYYGTEIKKVNGALLDIDGQFGPRSKKGVAIAFQVELNKLGAGISVDGMFGSGSEKAFTSKVGVLKKGNSGIFCTLWQCLIVGLGENPNGIDGIFGNGCAIASNKIFKKYSLPQDSIVNGSDINKIL